MRVPALEKELGIEVYATQSPGIEGIIRQFPEDFVVEEILLDGSKAEVSPVETLEPVGKGRYLICVLVKRDWDTLLAVKKVAKQLGISRRRARIAGLKDARALTAQHVSIQDITHERVSRVKIKDIALHPLYYSNERIFSQLLLGNQFQTVIRAIPHTSLAIEQRVKNVQTELASLEGFPNFYGHQRFGTIRPITHLVGRFLALGDLEKAVLTFLAQPSLNERPESREARVQLQDTQNFEEALHSFPRYLRYERSMLYHLTKQPKDFVGAFRELPLKLRKLFVQAYQSFLFNKFLSQRIKKGIPLNESQIGDYGVKVDNHGLPIKEPVCVTARSLQTVKKELNEGRMRVAIPLVGYIQPPSQGAQGEIEQEILEREKVKPQDFHVPFMPEVSASGELRSIIAPVIGLSIGGASGDSANASKLEMNFGFKLHRGSYATILLREFMKPQDLIKAGF